MAINIPESLKTDTGHPLQWQTVPKSTSQQGIDLDANLQHDQLQDEDEQDTIIHDADVLHNDYDHTAIDTIADGTSIQLEKQITELFPTDDVTIPNEKVGCIDIYHMLSLLDKYLYDNPKQHTHCMSLDNECVALLKYAIHLNTDISTFPTVWAVLSILLDTQDDNLENVKLLQEEYNRYYKSRSRKYMEKLEKKSIAIQNHMHNSVTHDFEKIGKANTQIALQASTRATKASKDTQDIKMTDNAATGEDSTVDVHLPPHFSGKAKYPS